MNKRQLGPIDNLTLKDRFKKLSPREIVKLRVGKVLEGDMESLRDLHFGMVSFFERRQI